MQVDPRDPERHWYVGISVAGLFETRDAGATWEPRNRGVEARSSPDRLPEVGQCTHSFAVHPAAPDVIWRQDHCGMYRSEDGGLTWSRIREGLPSDYGFGLAVHPADPRTAWCVPLESDSARVTAGGLLRVYRTTDGGRSWQPQDRGLPR